ncbi:unnamed protein product [Arctogadus glacialis]
MHDFRRTIKEIIAVVKVCEATLRKRLTEFEATPTSHLTVEEFMKVDLATECDPPSFTAGKTKNKMAELEMELEKKMVDVEGEIQSYHDEIETELESCRPKLKGVYAAYTGHDESDSAPEVIEGEEVDEEVDEELMAVAKHFGKELSELSLADLEKGGGGGGGGEDDEEEQEVAGGGRRGPSLESILGPMPTAASLGLQDSIRTAVDEEKENGPQEEVSSGPQEVRSGPQEEVCSGPQEEVRSGPQEEVCSGPQEEVCSGPQEEVSSGPQEEVCSGPQEEVSSVVNRAFFTGCLWFM